MQRSHIEPVKVWGLEPCESLKLSINTFVTAGGAETSRTRQGLGAAPLRSNVAEQISFSDRRQNRREREDYYDSKYASSATAPSPTNLLEMAFESHCLFRTVSGLFVSIIRSRLSATSKVAPWISHV